MDVLTDLASVTNVLTADSDDGSDILNVVSKDVSGSHDNYLTSVVHKGP
jgi:hypothetical protein